MSDNKQPIEAAATEQARPRDKRRRNIRVTAIAVTAVVAVAVVLLNIIVGVLADRFPLSIDLTEDEVYSLTDEGIKIAEQIDKDVTVTFFMQEEILKKPGSGDDFIDTVLRQMHALIYEYAARAAGKVTVHYVDLTENPNLAAEYKLSVASGGILFQCDGKEKYFTIDDMVYQDNYSMYGGSQMYSLVEKTYATGFLSVMGSEELQVGFLTGNGEKEVAIAGMASIYQSNGYTVHKINFATAAEIPAGCKVLVVAGADKDFTDEQIERLSSWLRNDGKQERHLYVLCDPAAKEMPKFYEFLKVEYGIEVTDKVIYETDPNKLVSAQLPTFPLVGLQENELLPELKGSQVLMGTSVALKTQYENNADNLLFNTDMLVLDQSTAKLQAVKTDADGKPTTELITSEEPIVGLAMARKWKIINDASGSTEVGTYVMVSGGYYTVDSEIFSPMFSNEALVIDTVNTMCDNEIKVTVSAFSISTDTLTYTVGETTVIGLGIFTLGIPAALLVIGLVVFIRRRHL